MFNATRLRSRLSSNDNEAQLCAARMGVGILAGGDWLMTKDLREGRLVRVLPKWQLNAETGGLSGAAVGAVQHGDDYGVQGRDRGGV